MDIPRIFNITESAHRIHNPITAGKLATLGAALRLESGARVLDLGSGSGEMLCTWAREHGRLRIETDHWTMGVSSLDMWRRVLRETGFEVHEGRYNAGNDEYTAFACVKTG